MWAQIHSRLVLYLTMVSSVFFYVLLALTHDALRFHVAFMLALLRLGIRLGSQFLLGLQNVSKITKGKNTKYFLNSADSSCSVPYPISWRKNKK